MAFDFKKEYREFYLPKAAPGIVDVPQMRFIAVRGAGDPNAPDGDYSRALNALYAVAYTIKMSKLGDRRIEGYFDYVVPPLEGFWRQEGVEGIDYRRKADFRWISCIRLPDFAAPADVEWAKDEALRRKRLDCSAVQYMALTEGLCVQIMHLGPYDDEPASVAKLDAFIRENGYVNDFSDSRLHHEIYLSDPRRTAAEKLKTVIRHPIRKL